MATLSYIIIPIFENGRNTKMISLHFVAFYALLFCFAPPVLRIACVSVSTASRTTSPHSALFRILLTAWIIGSLCALMGQPVCHEALGAAAAPGQMSATDIMAERRALFLAPKRYYLVGSPIGKSPSPDMHNAAFERIGLPHVYGLCDTLDVAADFAAVAGALGADDPRIVLLTESARAEQRSARAREGRP